MKILKSILSIVFLISIVHAFSQSNPKERILIRIYESENAINFPRILVTDQSNTEIVPLEVTFKTSRERNDKTILTTLCKYLDKGYKIETSNATANEKLLITTYILIKE